MMKKSQIEIAGLGIIAVIIIVVVIFLGRILYSQNDADYNKEIVHSQLASNMVNTFLTTTSECSNLSMAALLQDCAKNPNSPGITCGLLDSCSYVKQESKKIFEKSLDQWNIGYEFKVFFDENNKLFSLGKECYGNRKSELFLIPTEKGVLIVRMDICE